MQVRTADRLRASLARDEVNGMPAIDALSDQDQRELCEVGGNRLAAVAIRVSAGSKDLLAEDFARVAIREVARLVDEHVRRTDLIGYLQPDTLVVIAPGLEPGGGPLLIERLREFLANRQVEFAGTPVELRVRVGAAYRSAASAAGWTTHALLAEARHNATEAIVGPNSN